MKELTILIIIFFFISCDNVQKEYYKNGTLRKEFSLKKGKLQGVYKEYYDNGKMKLIHHYDNGKNRDSSLYFYSHTNENIGVKKYWFDDDSYYQKEFYSNGKIKKEGLVLDSTIIIGDWNFYDNNGKLQEIREYKDIDGEPYLNQTYSLNEKRDTVSNGSIFVKILFSKDTIRLNEPLRAVTFLSSKFFKSKKSQIIVYLANGNSNFTKNFSNENKIRLDTFYNLTIDTINQKWYKDYDYNRITIFGKWFDATGSKDIRGYISEYYDEDPTETDSVIREERKIYFDKTIYVKDSLD